jgi:hypothetical protein
VLNSGREDPQIVSSLSKSKEPQVSSFRKKDPAGRYTSQMCMVGSVAENRGTCKFKKRQMELRKTPDQRTEERKRGVPRKARMLKSFCSHPPLNASLFYPVL